MKLLTGRTIPLSVPRRVVCDSLYASSQLSQVMGEYRINIGPLLADRKLASPRPSLIALFIKAFASVAVRRPDLRRVFVSRPWHRLYEYDRNVISVVIARDYQGESALFIARLEQPEEMSLAEIDEQLRQRSTKPIEKISGFRNAIRFAKLPLFLRRLFWSTVMNWMPRTRGNILGTLGFSVTAATGGAALSLITPWTTTVCYDAPDDHGTLPLRIAIDHRVYDGKLLGSVVADVKRELLGPIRAEVVALRRAVAA